MPQVQVGEVGFDGRSDIIMFEADRASRKASLGLRTAEDVFVETARTLRSDGDNPRLIAGRLWRPERVEKALSVWAEIVRPLARTMTFRVIVRVLQEQSFLRTDLRLEVTQVVGRDRPRWRIADPADIEIWVIEYARGHLAAGLRLSDVRMRQHDGRRVERQGALRPAVAAAMVQLAGKPSGKLLDPCSGSGTILVEAVTGGWQAVGLDIDPSAVEIARRNVADVEVAVGDARNLPFENASLGGCVSNLPFGRQFTVQGETKDWLAAVLGEMERVTRPGGRVVLLAPQIPRSVVPGMLRMTDRFRLRLLGSRTTLWAYDRVNSSPRPLSR